MPTPSASTRPLSNKTAQLRITLNHTAPTIWRLVIVPHDIKLPALHHVIQIAMGGWSDSHMHAFRTKAANYEMEAYIEEIADFVSPMFGSRRPQPKRLSEEKHTLADILPERKSRAIYEYDFGDSWEHELRIEKFIPTDKRLAHAEVIAGENACPPEDCGGIPGYYNLLDILDSPKHPEHANMREWLDLEKNEKIDPAIYNIAAANAELKRLKV